MGEGGFGDDLSCLIRNWLQFIEKFVKEAKEDRVTVVDTTGDEAVDQDGGSLRGEEGTETIHVSEVVGCHPGGILMWVRKERELSRMTPRLFTWEVEVTKELLVESVKLLNLERTDLMQMRPTSVLLLLSWGGNGGEPAFQLGQAGCEGRLEFG